MLAAIPRKVQDDLNAHWFDLTRLIMLADDMPETEDIKTLKRHIELIERNLSNKIMAKLDNNLSYQK